MGLLRLYLALCVFHDHVNNNAPRMFLSSSVAVCIFFIISGFYMSLVINENYKNQNNGIISFYINRFLRLYPIYIIILLTFGIVFKKFLNIDLSQFNDIWWLIKQLLIFPEVVINNFNLKPDTTFLIFGQMYTVGLEFIFYALAPFLVTRKNIVIFGLLILSVVVHFLPNFVDQHLYRYQYEFFPYVLVFFVLGIISYKIYQKLINISFNKSFVFICLIILIGYVFLNQGSFNSGQWTNSIQTSMFYLLIVLFIPILFKFTKFSYLDRLVGDMSYPLYIIHFPIIWILKEIASSEIFIWIVTIVISFIIVILIDRPIDKLRHYIGKLNVKSVIRNLIAIFLGVILLFISFKIVLNKNEILKIKVLNEHIPSNFNYLLNYNNENLEIVQTPIRNYINYYKILTEFLPYSPEGFGLLGYCYYKKGELNQALKSYLKARELAPNFLWYNLNLGIIYSQLNNYDEGRKYFNLAINSDLKENLSFIINSRVYYQLRTYDNAQIYIQSQVDLLLKGLVISNKFLTINNNSNIDLNLLQMY